MGKAKEKLGVFGEKAHEKLELFGEKAQELAKVKMHINITEISRKNTHSSRLRELNKRKKQKKIGKFQKSKRNSLNNKKKNKEKFKNSKKKSKENNKMLRKKNRERKHRKRRRSRGMVYVGGTYMQNRKNLEHKKEEQRKKAELKKEEKAKKQQAKQKDKVFIYVVLNIHQALRNAKGKQAVAFNGVLVKAIVDQVSIDLVIC